MVVDFDIPDFPMSVLSGSQIERDANGMSLAGGIHDDPMGVSFRNVFIDRQGFDHVERGHPEAQDVCLGMCIRT